MRIDLHNRTHRLTSPRRVAFSLDFAPPLQVVHSEKVWSEIESRAGLALKDLTAGHEFDETVVKDLLALHLVRSNDMIDACHNLLNSYEPVSRLTQRSFEELKQHALERTGLHIAGPEAALMEQQEINKMIYQHFREDLAEHLPLLLAQVQRLFRTWNLEILTCASAGELVIGDTPAVTIDPTGTRTGLDSGVWLQSAAAVFMPLTPTVLAAVGPLDATTTLTREAIARFNLFQCQRATRYVFCSPGSGLHTWILAEHEKALDAMENQQGTG